MPHRSLILRFFEHFSEVLFHFLRPSIDQYFNSIDSRTFKGAMQIFELNLSNSTDRFSITLMPTIAILHLIIVDYR